MNTAAKPTPQTPNSDGVKDNELYLVDGSGFIFRAYYAMAYGRGDGAGMTNPEGVPVGAVYGFINMILKMLKDYDAPYMAVIFDAARENFRNDIYPAYKANRDDTPEDLIPQFALIREATEAFDLPAIDLVGYEADDLIAAYTRLARAAGKEVVIVSSDKDLMQLVGEGVRMLDPMKGKFIGEAEVIEKFGVPPEKVVDVQSLAGDSTDNVPGVPGIGVKTAALLINEYGDLETLLERAGEIKQKGRREKLLNHADDARVSKKLVQLDAHAPVPVALGDLHVHKDDKPELVEFVRKHNFKSILKRLTNGASSPPSVATGDTNAHNTSAADFPPPEQNTYTLINDMRTLKSWIDEAFAEGVLVIDTETTGLTPAKAKLVGISLTSKLGKAAYIPLGHVRDNGASGDLFGAPVDDNADKDMIEQLPLNDVIATLTPILTDASVMKIAHNMKYDWQMFAAHGVEITPCDDTMLISYTLDGTSHSHSMDNLSKIYCDFEPTKFTDVAGKGKAQITFDKVDINAALDYAAEDAEITLRLYKVLKPRLTAERMVNVYENIDRPLIEIIAKMEMTGIKIDPIILGDMSVEFGKKIAALEGDIHDLAGTPFNIASPKQVGEILFDQMGLKGGKKTKTGAWSTSVSVLEKLAADGEEIVEKILAARQLAKLKSTYTDALQAQINPRTGRVHTSFAMAHTSTGRLASSDPNVQNIPIRTPEGRRIREAFIAENDHVLISVDYSQIELRLAAELAGIKALQEAFKNGADIHKLTASQVFDTPFDEVTAEQRRSAKAVNFGIIYGISGWGLAKQLGCDAGTANEFIKKYLARFPELQTYMDEQKAYAREHGFVKTAYGRKCYIDGAQDKNAARRSFADRQAINAPLQGTAADVMKIAMAAMPRALSDAGLNARMLLQVHDELIFEAHKDEPAKTQEVVIATMQRAYQSAGVHINVPLNAEGGAGDNWEQAH